MPDGGSSKGGSTERDSPEGGSPEDGPSEGGSSSEKKKYYMNFFTHLSPKSNQN